MGSLVTPRAATISGVVLLVFGVLLAGAIVLTTPFTGCTEVGVPDDKTTGFEFVGLEDGNIAYSPDGVNVCQSPIEVVAIPLVPGIGGLVLFGYGRYSAD